MKLIILDYFRRKGLVLLGGAILEFVIGMFSGSTGAEHIHPLGTLQIQISIFMGAFLLSLDLQRGITRTFASLPVTIGQIARAWWYATVGITSLVLIACLFAGAGVGLFIHSGIGVDWNWVGLAAVCLFLWMGTGFTLIFFVSGAGFWYGSGWRRGVNILAGLGCGLMLGGGFWLFQGAENHPLKLILMLAFGAGMTIIGWFCAEKLVAARASFKPGTQAARRKQGAFRLPGGYGGIPYLVGTTCLRTLFIGLVMVALIALVFWMQDSAGLKWRNTVKEMLGMGFFPFWVVTLVSCLPLLLQIRLLRSLPISSTVLSMVMMTAAVLPQLALGSVIVAITGPFLGMAATLNLAGSLVLGLSISVISLVLILWLGYGRLSLILMMALLLVSQGVPPWLHIAFHYGQIPLATEMVIAVVTIIAGGLLARWLLMRNSKVYRSMNAFGNSMWWQGR